MSINKKKMFKISDLEVGDLIVHYPSMCVRFVQKIEEDGITFVGNMMRKKSKVTIDNVYDWFKYNDHRDCTFVKKRKIK